MLQTFESVYFLAFGCKVDILPARQNFCQSGLPLKAFPLHYGQLRQQTPSLYVNSLYVNRIAQPSECVPHEKFPFNTLLSCVPQACLFCESQLENGKLLAGRTFHTGNLMLYGRSPWTIAVTCGIDTSVRRALKWLASSLAPNKAPQGVYSVLGIEKDGLHKRDMCKTKHAQEKEKYCIAHRILIFDARVWELPYMQGSITAQILMPEGLTSCQCSNPALSFCKSLKLSKGWNSGCLKVQVMEFLVSITLWLGLFVLKPSLQAV